MIGPQNLRLLRVCLLSLHERDDGAQRPRASRFCVDFGGHSRWQKLLDLISAIDTTNLPTSSTTSL